MTSPAQDYRDDDNLGKGWLVRCSWENEERDIEQTFPTLGKARQSGLQLSCLNGVTKVLVLTRDGDLLACRYQRSDNLWRDELDLIKNRENYLTQLDLAGHLLSHHQKEITDHEREVTLKAIKVGGGTAHDYIHNVRDQLLREGLVASTDRKFSLTESGEEWLKEHSAD